MPTRKGFAVWEGSFRDGKGAVTVESGLLEAPYSASARFEAGAGTNPEELLGAAHAGCFSMALALALSLKGAPPRKIETTAEVTIEPDGPGYTIKSSALHTVAEVPEILEGTFLRIAEDVKKSCPVSRALAGVEITLDARLIS